MSEISASLIGLPQHQGQAPLKTVGRKIRIALAPAFAHNPTMLARVLFDAFIGIEAFPVEEEVNCGWGDTLLVHIMSISPIHVHVSTFESSSIIESYGSIFKTAKAESQNHHAGNKR